MIQEFSVQNFLSFKDKQTISFVASKDKTLSEELTFEPKAGLRILRTAMVYGANASGKTNLLQAIQALWLMLFEPTEKEHEKIVHYQPFELTKGEPTRFEITFWANSRCFHYQIEFDKYSVLYEKMEYTSDKGILSDMYERKKGFPIQFGSTVGIKAKQRDELNLETLVNHTVLSSLNKKNIDVPKVIKELYDWIKVSVHELGRQNSWKEIAEETESNPLLKSLILELLNKADFNITDFRLIEITIPEDIAERIANDDTLSESARRSILQPQKQLLFSHETDKETFLISWGLQSAGTRVYFRLARLLFDLKNRGCILMEDEIDDSLHYDLIVHYLQTFLQASTQSQLLFSTHNQLLLDEDWLIRRDMIWFIEKDRKSASSTLYRASDMGIHKNTSLMNAYRLGKLGAKPLLGSTLLESGEI